MAFDAYNPIAVFVYFAAVVIPASLYMHPVLLALSLTGAVSLCCVRGSGNARQHLISFALFSVMTLVNPLFQHNGATVLFVLNDNPVTLEALLYGAAAAGMIVAVLYWFRSFTQIMTSDKLLYLFGRLSPKTALLLSMTLRYIPLFARQTRKVNASQKALGLYREDNIIDTVRGGLRVFSVMVTWALENGIITADSMAARGYGTGRRTYFSLFRFGRKDALFLALTVMLALGTILTAESCTFYPHIVMPDGGVRSALGLVFYGLLAFLPTCIEAGDKIKWQYLQSGI